MASIHRGAEEWLSLVPLILANQGPVPPPLRVQIGRKERQRALERHGSHAAAAAAIAGKLIRGLKGHWRPALLLSTLLEPPAPQPPATGKRSKHLTPTQRCNEVEECVTELGLACAWEIRPLLDGRAIKAAMGLGGGPQLGEWVGRCMDWQLANPQATAEECTQWLQRHAEQCTES